MAEFKDRLKILRTNEGLSQRGLAEKLNMSKSSISMYEGGQRKPDFEALETIADFFNVDIDYLSDVSFPHKFRTGKEICILCNILLDILCNMCYLIITERQQHQLRRIRQ